MARKFDPKRYHVTVHGREESQQQAAYMQDGVYFDGAGNEIPGQVAPKASAKETAPASTSQVDKQLAGQ